MQKVAILIAAVLLSTSVACEKDAASSASTDESGMEAATESETSDEAAQARGYSVGKLRIVAGSNVFSNPEVLKPEALEGLLEETLEETNSYDSGAPELSGTVTYDARAAKDVNGRQIRDVVLFGELRRKGDDPTSKFSAKVVLSSDVESENVSHDELTRRAAERFAQQIDAQIRINGAEKATLIEVLRSSKESDKAKLTAVQEIREREIAGTEVELRKLLNGDDDSLKAPAAAALVKLGDAESHDQILEVAQQFSRDKNPSLLPMLYILGDIGGPEVITYLDTLADAHPVPEVRQVAKEAVQKAVKLQGRKRGQGAEIRPTEDPTRAQPE